MPPKKKRKLGAPIIPQCPHIEGTNGMVFVILPGPVATISARRRADKKK